MFIYNCIVNETAAFEWLWSDFYNYILNIRKCTMVWLLKIYNYIANIKSACPE